MSKIKNLDKAINTICASLAKREKDGIGYAIQGKSGVFGERSVKADNFKTDFTSEILDLPFLSNDYNRIGQKSKAVGAGIFHGRTSTNDKTLINTHPIMKHNWTLIHNGVVSNHGPSYDMMTTNDTEHIIENIAQSGVSGIEKNLTGYYAIAAFSPDDKLHIIRDNIATLYFAHIKSIDSYIIGTTQDLINEVCKAMHWQCSKLAAMRDNSHVVFYKNKVESYSKIKPLGRTINENKYASLSLGYELESKDNASKYSEDEILFLEEVNLYSDASYQFFDYRQNALTFQEFKALSDIEKLDCIVIRPDGTLVDCTDYHTEKLYYNY
jgi:glucosamine 6-phosphate synthetase-like amidotransferase/phosphosugar isomerase protein